MKIPALVEPGPELPALEARRYSRQTVMPQISELGQQRLANAKVVCVGAGGLGSPALLYLAAAGVGTIGIIDFDTVDETNLARQVIHGHSDIGKSKVASAKTKIAEVNPFIQIVEHEFRLDPSNVMEIFEQYDLIVDGTDNFATRYLINDACVLLGKPYVWGSVLRFDGQASIFWAKHGPCYRCLHPVPAADVPNCAQAGVLGASCAAVASIQVTEAIKLITGIGQPLIGSLLIYDGLEMKYEKIAIGKDPQCSICGVDPTQVTLLADYESFCAPASPESITVLELKAKMDDGDDFQLIDVREPAEYEIVAIPGAVLIPLAGFLDGSALSKLNPAKTIILHCRSGVRSATALNILRINGFNDATHVEGGVLAWAQQIDPTCTVY